ncbi:MAG: cytochrome c-type biogenesis protein CcmH [Chloroflexi bacterium]|nr:cytochrome c-type biogenesis protein CcmH [Chloroflexota bacterium]MBU1662633.1 cytochrome c-type biogenesis protein CcmH [Chloroflexota bacterium]
MKSNSAILLLILSLLFISVNIVSAQVPDPDAPTDDEVNAIARELYCPVCENIPLDVCGTQACADWREEIRLELADGWDSEQIKQNFVDRFGDRVLAEPPRQGLNWLVYIVPPAIFIVSVFILFKGIRSWRQIETESVPPAEDKTADEYATRLEEELRRRDLKDFQKNLRKSAM